MADQVLVGVVMGSNSDWDTMQHAVQILEQFNIPHEKQVLSAHRMPDEMFAYAEKAEARGLKAIIAGAGGAAHLPGMLAAKTIVPIWGVPVPSKYLRGEDSLYSIVQMPKGIPVASFGAVEQPVLQLLRKFPPIVGTISGSLYLIDLKSSFTTNQRALIAY